MPSRKLAVAAFVALLMVSSMPFCAHLAKGEFAGIELVTSSYTGTNVYVPGETLDIILRGEEGDVFDVEIGSGAVTGLDLVDYQDRRISQGDTLKIQYEIDEKMPDGTYHIDVFDSTGADLLGHEIFYVQGYRFVIETDRRAYIGGDTLNIYWTANNIKDESLAADGVGKIQVLNESGQIYAEHLFTEAAGSYSYLLPYLIDIEPGYRVTGWFNSSAVITGVNGSAVLPERSQGDVRSFNVSSLAAIISLDSEVYAPGALVNVDVRTLATENRDNPGVADPPEPTCEVNIQIYQKIGGQFTAVQDLNWDVISDSHGIANCVFQIASGVGDGTEFSVLVNVTKGARPWFGEEYFEVSTSAGLSIVITLDKAQYTSGDTVNIGTTVSTIGSPSSTTYTYVYEVRDNDANGSLLARATASMAGFNYSIPDDFEGNLWISVTVDDGKGNKATVYKTLEVKFAIVLVNADVERYMPGDVVKIDYSLISKIMVDPSIFYEVKDADGASVFEGNATGGSFTFTVPSAPSESYTIRVLASESGRLVFGEATISQTAGFAVVMEFNRNAYSPGDTIAVNYRIITMGSTPMPASFRITYGLSNGDTLSTQTNESEGTILYEIPATIDEGEQVFWMSIEGGGMTTEVITVKDNPNPLWYTRIFDMPLFDILLFMLVLLCLALIVRNSRRIGRYSKDDDEVEVEAVASKKATSPVKTKRQPSTSAANTVPCESCGAGIEISTSKRPIEVMCPACGETQVVSK